MEVKLSKQAQKDLKKLASNISILRAYKLWELSVENYGLQVLRDSPGYHDEKLKAVDLRSSRLSKGYRVIYKVVEGEFEICSVEAINKHDYKKTTRK